MVDRMMPQSLLQMLLAAGLGAVAMPSAAQGMTDPTQPPASLAASGPGEVVVAPSGLQTIIRRNGATPGAIISGHYVELGGMVGEAKLVKVGEDRVELRGPAGREVMFLTPAVEKKMPVSAGQSGGHKGARAPTKDGAGK